MRYVDETYHFSFELFSGFRAAEGTLRSGRYVITVENDTGVWMLIVVSPFDGTVPVLTKEMIVADVQDITISNDEPFSISGVTGLLFDSTDPLWDGNARELWFVEGGYLYQLSTKREWQALLVESARSWRKESL